MDKDPAPTCRAVGAGAQTGITVVFGRARTCAKAVWTFHLTTDSTTSGMLIYIQTVINMYSVEAAYLTVSVEHSHTLESKQFSKDVTPQAFLSLLKERRCVPSISDLEVNDKQLINVYSWNRATAPSSCQSECVDPADVFVSLPVPHQDHSYIKTVITGLV